jgi:CheY-like chemotaxis protein
VQAWQERSRQGGGPAPVAAAAAPTAVSAVSAGSAPRPRLLVIEDSVHYQTLISLLVAQQFPQLELHLAPDGIVGLTLHGSLQPQLLVVDILLPGIDGATLITSLRSQPQFAHSQLIVVTSLDEEQRQPYAFALSGVPVVHKSRLVQDLPAALERALAASAAQSAGSKAP